ncbi:MAG: extracellular solute-binding protein [Candidatus Firestonebacteria bacterium]
MSRDDTMKIGVDGLLHEGILPGGSILLEGSSGTGKTMFGLQFIYKSNEPSIFLSFSNTEEEILNYYAKNFNWNFSGLKKQKRLFIVSDVINVYKSMFNFKSSFLYKLIRKYKIKRIVIDSINPLYHISKDAVKFHNILLSFLRKIKNENISVLLINNENMFHYLDCLVDIIIKLGINEEPFKRTISVLKSRWSPFSEGKHLLKITNNGLKVYPNLEHLTRELSQKSIKKSYIKVKTGISKLDEVLDGGFLKGEISLIGGQSGIGKTLFSLKFLKTGIEFKEKCLYIGFDIEMEKLARTANLINFNLKEVLNKGTLEILNISQDLFIEEILDKIFKLANSNIERVVIDEIKEFENKGIILFKVIKILKTMFLEKGLLLTLNTVNSEEEIFKIADNVILLKYTEIENRIRKIIYVIKASNIDCDKSVRELLIDNNEIRTGKSLEIYQNILSGSAKKIEIKLITYKGKAIENIINDFQKIHPDIKVEILDIDTWDNLPYIKENITSNKNIGVVPLEFNTMQLLAKDKFLLELDNVLSDEDKKDFFHAGLEGCSFGGCLYAIPDDIKCELIVYRKDLLRKYGFLPPKTWDELIKQVEIIIKKENNPNLSGLMWFPLDGNNLVNLFLSLLYNNDGEIYKKGGKLGLLEKNVVDTLQFIQDLIYKFKIVPEEILRLRGNEKIKKLCEGNMIFFLCSSLLLKEIFNNTKYKLDLMRIPLGEEGKEATTVIWEFAYGISKSVSFPQSSIELLKFFTSFENQKKVELLGGGSFSARKSICFDKDVLKDKPFYKDAPKFFEEVKIKNIHKIPSFEKIFPVLRNAIWNTLNNKIEPYISLKNAAVELKSLETKPLYSHLASNTINFLEENLHKPLKLTTVSDFLKLSPFHLSRVFKKETGKTIFEYLTYLRIEKSKKLLKDIRLNVNEASMRCGFKNTNYFSKVFKKINGLSPSEYRKSSM